MITNYSYNPVNFTAVRLQPKSIEKWDDKLLNATLDSPYIKKLIKNNEAVGKDTVLEYVNSKDEGYQNWTREVAFNVKSGDETQFNAISTGRVYEYNTLRDAIIDKIKNKDKAVELQEKLEKLKSIASTVIYE